LVLPVREPAAEADVHEDEEQKGRTTDGGDDGVSSQDSHYHGEGMVSLH